MFKMEAEKQKSMDEKRKFIEVDPEVVNKLRILCFLKEITMKKFVTDAMKKELEPYESWLENVKKLQCDNEE